jgi:hypothetical protein
MNRGSETGVRGGAPPVNELKVEAPYVIETTEFTIWVPQMAFLLVIIIIMYLIPNEGLGN